MARSEENIGTRVNVVFIMLKNILIRSDKRKTYYDRERTRWK